MEALKLVFVRRCVCVWVGGCLVMCVSVDRSSTICINPWHYERCDEEKFLSKSVGHECQVRLFADAVYGTRTLCFLCKSPGIIERTQPSIPTMPLSPPTPPPGALELTPINVTNNVIPDQDQELKIYVERPKYKIEFAMVFTGILVSIIMNLFCQ